MREEQIGLVLAEYESLTILGVDENVSRIMTYFIHEDTESYVILTRYTH
jgi:hypothetical protein